MRENRLIKSFQRVARPTLRSEIQDVANLINIPKIRKISREYVENDAAVQDLIRYFHCDEFQAAWSVFKASPEVEDIFEWVKTHGYYVEREIKSLSGEIAQMLPKHLHLYRSKRSTEKYSVRSFEEELKAQIRFDDLNVLIGRLLTDGNDFTHLYLILKLSRPALEDLLRRPEVQTALNSLEELGVNTESIKITLYELLRWN